MLHLEVLQIGVLLQQGFLSNIVTDLFPKTNCIHVTYEKVPWIDNIFMQINMPIVLTQNPHNFNECAYIIISTTMSMELIAKYPYHTKVLIIHDNKTIALFHEILSKKLFAELIIDASILYINQDGSDYNFMKSSNKKWSPNLRNQTFRIALFHYEPLVFYNPEQGFYDGIEKKILDAVIQDWKVAYNVYPVYNWENISQDVVHGNADIGLCGLWRDSVNFTEADMTNHYTQACTSFVVPKPKLLPITISYILESFNYLLYIVIVLVIILLACLLKFLNKQISWCSHFLLFYQITILVGVPRLPRDTAVKFIVGGWCLNTILINIFYGAGLTRRLSFPAYTPPVNTFADMLHQHVEWQLRSNGILPLITSSHDYYKQQLLNILVNSTTNGNQRFDYSAYGQPINIIFNYVDIPDDDFMIAAQQAKPLTECLCNSYFVMPLKKNSPFKKLLNNKLQQIDEAGLVHQWYNMFHYMDYKTLKWLPLFHQTYPDQEQFIELNLLHLQGAFIVLGVGYSLALVIFIKELLGY